MQRIGLFELAGQRQSLKLCLFPNVSNNIFIPNAGVPVPVLNILKLSPFVLIPCLF